MHPTSHPSASLFGVAFLQAVRRALPQLLLATIAAGLATYLAQSWITPRYVAEARIELVGVAPGAAAEAHVRALKDPIRLFAVASELGLQDRSEFNGQDGASGPLARLGIGARRSLQGLRDADERLLTAVYERFAAAPAGDGSIAVRLASADPKLAARFVNRVVEAYLAGMGSKTADSSVPNEGGVQVAAWAEAPTQPQSSRRGKMAILGMAAMLMLGLGGIATREAFRATGTPRHTDVTGTAAGEERRRSGGAPFIAAPSPAAAAGRLLSVPAGGRGCRTMVAGEAPDIDAKAEALAVAQDLSHSGRQVVLVRWRPAGDEQGSAGGPGLNDLLEGRANFEQVIAGLPGSTAHAISAGSPARDRSGKPDPDLIGLVLDTLDEVYDHIVVLADHLDARSLFAAIEGRFDACISVGEAGRPAGAFAADVDQFLGFEVTDIHLIRLERRRRPVASAARPLLRPRMA